LVTWHVTDTEVLAIVVVLIQGSNTHAATWISRRATWWSLYNGIASICMRITEPVLPLGVDTSATSPAIFCAKRSPDPRVSNEITTYPFIGEGIVYKGLVWATPKPFANWWTDSHSVTDRFEVCDAAASRLDSCLASCI
jgi:hypothetical protein